MLDKSRNYYTISQNPDNIRFKQDEKFFYNDGRPVDDEIPIVVEEKLEDLGWREIKSKVLEANGEWTNKSEGIEFLKG